MANTYTQLFIHAIFVVKGRQNIIPDQHKDEIYKYIGGTITKKANKLYIVNGAKDHIHILFGQNPDISLSDLIRDIKRSSSIFINENKWIMGKFEWQKGYAAFTYSKSQLEKVFNYIANQEQHHKIKTFKEEYIELLKKFEVEYNEKYLFEDV